MLETKQQARSSVPIDPDTHAECLEFIRAAISASDQEFAEQIAKILKEVCQNGHAEPPGRAELTAIELQQLQSLLARPSIAGEFAKKIKDAATSLPR